jgi:pteridine reductase
MMTRSLAKDLAPNVRVNGISPGAILWPENNMNESLKENILQKIPMQRSGSPEDIADCITFLIRDASYITGQIITIDGGRSFR